MLKERRLDANLLQDQLAEKVNVDVRTVRKIENNEVKGSPYLQKNRQITPCPFDRVRYRPNTC